MARVFLSYARDDRGRVSELAGALERAGHIVWWDRRLTGGAEFEREIERALSDAEVVVVAWSDTASKSHWVRDEAAAGRDSDRLVPVTLDEALPPLGFRQFHTIDLSSWRGDDAADCPELEDAVAAKAGEAQLSGSEAAAPIAKMRNSRGRRLLPLWAWSLIVGLALVPAAAGWWLMRPSPGVPTLALGRFESAGASVESGLSASIEQEVRAALGALGVPLTAANADLVLTGSVRRVGESLRLVMRLEDVVSATTLWSKSQDIPAGDPRALIESARSIASIMDCGQDGARGYRGRLRNESFALYLRYCDASTPGQMLDAARNVAAQAPDFVGGWLGVAESANLHAWTDPSNEDVALQTEGLAAARRAIEIAPELSDGHILLAALMPPEQAAERESLLRRAIGLESFRCACAYQYLGDFLLQAGRAEEALVMYQRSVAQQSQEQELDSLWRVAMANFLTGLTNQGAESMRRLEQLHPNSPGLLHLRRNAALWAGRWGEAAEMFRLARPEEQAAVRAAYLALQSRDPGRIAEAGAALERLPVRPRIETIMIPALAQLGRLDTAFAALDASRRGKQGYSAPGRFPGISLPMLWDPLLRPLWYDRRFPTFLHRAGFIAYWRQSGTRPDVCRVADAPAFCRALDRER